MNFDLSCLSGLSSGAFQQLPHSEGTHRSLGQAELAGVLSPRMERRREGQAGGSSELCTSPLPNRSFGK